MRTNRGEDSGGTVTPTQLFLWRPLDIESGLEISYLVSLFD